MAFNFTRFAREGRLKKLRKCFEHGVFIDAANINGETAVFCSALKGRVKCLEFLLTNGADPNRANVDGMTPLHAAIQSSQFKCVGILLQYGSDLHLIYADFPTILAFARYHGNRETLRMIESFMEDEGMGQHQPAQNYNAIIMTTCASTSQLQIVEEVPERIPIIDMEDLKKPEHNNSFTGTYYNYVDGCWGGNLVTVKHAPEFNENDFYFSGLKKEINLLRQLRHFRFPVAMAICAEPFCLILERFYFSTLSHYLHDTNMEMDSSTEFTVLRVIRIMLDVAQALSHLHEKQWVHCHVTPHSIFVSDGPRAKLGSLEFCERPDETLCMDYFENELPWLSPEILKGAEVDYPNDIYSFAATFWECLTRNVPWSWLQDTKIPASRQLPIIHGWPAMLRTILSHCFEDPQHRPTAAEVCQKLEGMVFLKMPLRRAQLDELFKEWLAEETRQRTERSGKSSMSSRSELLSVALGETYSSLVKDSCDSSAVYHAHTERRKSQSRRRSAVVTSLVEEALTTLVHIGLPPTEIHEGDIYKFGIQLARDIAELRGLCSVAKRTRRKMWAKVAMATRDLEEEMFESLAGYEECTFRRKHAHAANLKKTHQERAEERLKENLDRTRSLIKRHKRKNWACYTMLLCDLYGILRRTDTIEDEEESFEQEAIKQSIVHLGSQMRKISSIVFHSITEENISRKFSSEWPMDIGHFSAMVDEPSNEDCRVTENRESKSSANNIPKRQMPYVDTRV